MEVDNAGETEFALVRQGFWRNNSILKLNQRNIIGRGFDTTLTVISLYVSRQHCIIYLGDDGYWYIRDCDTLNGTFVNEERLLPNTDYKLQINDKVGLGIGANYISDRTNPDYYVYKLTIHPERICNYDVNNLCCDLETKCDF